MIKKICILCQYIMANNIRKTMCSTLFSFLIKHFQLLFVYNWKEQTEYPGLGLKFMDQALQPNIGP